MLKKCWSIRLRNIKKKTMISETDQHTFRVCERGLPGGKLVVRRPHVARLLARDAGAPPSNNIDTI